MEFNPCLLIPCYDHGPQLRGVLRELRQFDLPCIVVDDGSGADTARVLDELAASEKNLVLHRNAVNGGKGAAVMEGMRIAQQRGFTHALQIDADGQHDVGDIPRLLNAASAAPAALISGWPQYGSDVPKSRLYGRYITHFWVWIETLSFAVKDTMCGFRVYPVAAARRLFEQRRLGTRMDFDIEVMVRLYWAGVPMQFVPTRVIYPQGGLSHFAVWRDNLRISWMHTRLVAEMLLRLPLRLLRRGDSGAHWSQHEERGAYWGMWISLQCYRLLGPRVLRVLLLFIISYFFVANRTARAASLQFLTRAFDQGAQLERRPNGFTVYRHLYQFGSAVVDRIGSWAGRIRRADVVFDARPQLQAQAQSGRGAVIFTSHLGNVEMCRALVDQVPGIKMNILVFTRHAEQINRLMREVNPRAGVELLQVGNVGPDTAILLQQKIDAGEFVVIAADRTSPAARQRVSRVDFLGAPADFPQGPFILAALLRCPVYLLFCLLENGRHHIHFELFAEQLQLPRRQRAVELAACVERFAQRLGYYAKRAPLQWFNFYDFWEPAPPRSAEGGSAVTATAAERSHE
jgi:predicted LPLAT superfamily acyltransferase